MPPLAHRRPPRAALLPLFALALMAYLPRATCAHDDAAPAGERWPVPSDVECQEAAALIDQVYGEEFNAASSPSQQLALARRLRDEALATYDNPAARYQLMLTALEHMNKNGRLNDALEILDDLARSHAIERDTMRAEILENILTQLTAPRDLENLAPQVHTLIDEATTAERFTAAQRMITAATQAATEHDLAELAEALNDQQNQLRHAQSQWEIAQEALRVLAERPADPAANLTVGRYHCFVRGDWQQGVPYLALGENEGLRKAARLELAAIASSVELKQVGDAWWGCELSLVDPGREAARRRAAFWYSVAVTELTGISKTTAEHRIGEVGPIAHEYPLAETRFIGRSPEVRSIAAQGVGATEESELAIELGLAWLADHQLFDGSWDFCYHGPFCENRCDEAGAFYAPLASTGLALLPLLGAGSSHQHGPYQENVAAGIDYLLDNMQYRGNMGTLLDARGIYSHSVCTLALCEAYLMTGDPALEDPIKHALYSLEQAQDPGGGGWNLVPGQSADLSVSAWALMALKTAHLAGLDTPDQAVIGMRRLLELPDPPENEDDEDDEPAMSPLSELLAATTPDDPRLAATDLLCRIYLGGRRDAPYIIGRAQLLAEIPPTNESLYYDFFAMQVFRLYRGDLWTRWHPELRDMLVATQDQTGHAAGSWHFDDDPGGVASAPPVYGDIGAHEGGRLYCTVMSLLILETYHRQSGLNL